MANPEHLDILKQGVAVWNEWRKEHPDERVDLEDAYLVDLTFTQLSDSAELHYTWRVKLSTKEMTPLSHHARSLSKS